MTQPDTNMDPGASDDEGTRKGDSTMDEETKATVGTLLRMSSDLLRTMNEAVRVCADEGPAVAMEGLADYLNGTDGVDPEIADALPADWLTRWRVEHV